MLRAYLERVKKENFLIHNISNYVSINDVANITLALGGRPIMAEATEEVEEIQKIADALCINTGMPNIEKVKAILKAGKEANRKGNNIVWDPVGVGVSEFRKNIAKDILRNIEISVIRGNIAEIESLVKILSREKLDKNDEKIKKAGVDVLVDIDNLKEKVSMVQKLSNLTNSIVIATGKTDILSNGRKIYLVKNGIEEMKKITGTGCMLSGLLATFVAKLKNKDEILEASLTATCTLGICSEFAKERMEREGISGNASIRNYIIDAMNSINPEDLEKSAKYEKYII